jgi:Phasin protein
MQRRSNNARQRGRMESKGKRIPRMTAPTDSPMEPVADTPADPISINQSAEEPMQPAGDTPADPISISQPAEEAIQPPELAVQRVDPPAPAPLPVPVQSALPDGQDGSDFYELLAQSRAVLAGGLESFGDEFASLARQSIASTAHTAIQMLGVRTWADAVAVSTSFARTTYEHWLDSAAKISELGVKLALESSRPFLNKFEKAWSAAHASR